MAYYTNLTKNDLLISDIGITIRAGSTVNPRQLNPSLSDAELHESEAIGALHRATVSKKIVKSDRPPKKENFSQKLKEATTPIPSRTRAGIAIDPKKKQYIEELNGVTDEDSLSKFEDYADGFAEPELDLDQDGGVLVEPAKTEPPSRYVDIKPPRY